MAKGCALSSGYLPRGGLPRNSVYRITDRPDMTSAVDRGRKESTQPKTVDRGRKESTQPKKHLKIILLKTVHLHSLTKWTSIIRTQCNTCNQILSM